MDLMVVMGYNFSSDLVEVGNEVIQASFRSHDELEGGSQNEST